MVLILSELIELLAPHVSGALDHSHAEGTKPNIEPLHCPDEVKRSC